MKKIRKLIIGSQHAAMICWLPMLKNLVNEGLMQTNLDYYNFKNIKKSKKKIG